MNLRAGIYVRISLDRQGKRAGVERQIADCRRLCESEGWSVVSTYEDNDRSAFSGRQRPEYERLLRDVASEELDVVVAWHSDRLWRDVMEQQAFLVLGRQSSLKLVATPGQRFDPGDADDSFMSTVIAAVAQKESADKSRRMTRKQVEKAERGEFHGGARAYGHTADRKAVVTSEAKVIREAARRVLRGESVRSVTLDLNRRGIKTARGGTWRQDVLSDLLQQPRLAGLREYHGEVVGQAAWPRILDRDTHERLQALFRSRKLGPRTRAVQKHLLTGE